MKAKTIQPRDRRNLSSRQADTFSASITLNGEKSELSLSSKTRPRAIRERGRLLGPKTRSASRSFANRRRHRNLTENSWRQLGVGVLFSCRRRARDQAISVTGALSALSTTAPSTAFIFDRVSRQFKSSIVIGMLAIPIPRKPSQSDTRPSSLRPRRSGKQLP